MLGINFITCVHVMVVLHVYLCFLQMMMCVSHRIFAIQTTHAVPLVIHTHVNVHQYITETIHRI